MNIYSSFEGADLDKFRQKLLKNNPWLAENYNLRAITARLKENAWLKEGMEEMPEWLLKEAHGHLRPDQEEALNAFRKKFLKTFGEVYGDVFPGDRFTDLGRQIEKGLWTLETAFEDLSGYSPLASFQRTYKITTDGKLLGFQEAKVGGVGCLSEDVLLGKVAPKDCPHSIFRDGFEYPEGHPFHRQGELIKPQHINGADYAPGGKLYQASAPAEQTPPTSEPAKPGPAEPVTEKKLAVRATPDAKDMPVGPEWTTEKVEALKGKLRVDKVEVVQRPMQILNAEGKWIDAEPALILRATKTLNDTTHTIELSGPEIIHAVKNPAELFEVQRLSEHPVLGDFFREHGLGVPPVPPGSGGGVLEEAGASATKAEEGIGKWVQRVFHEHPGKSWGTVGGIVAAGGAVAYLLMRKKEHKQETTAVRHE